MCIFTFKIGIFPWLNVGKGVYIKGRRLINQWGVNHTNNSNLSWKFQDNPKYYWNKNNLLLLIIVGLLYEHTRVQNQNNGKEVPSKTIPTIKFLL